MLHGVNLEHALPDGFYHRVVEHQVAPVLHGDQHALVAGQAVPLTDIEKALDFFVNAADREHIAELIECAGDGDALFDRNLR